MANPIPIPAQDVFTDKKGVLTDIAIKYLTGVGDQTAQSSQRLGAGIDLEDQSAAISSTPIFTEAIPAGIYRVTYYLQVTRAAGTSSSLGIEFSWEAFGVTQSEVSAIDIGNSLTTVVKGTFPIYSDANSPITFSTASYASVGAPSMQYYVAVVLEKVNA